jgi:hypothetical protein
MAWNKGQTVNAEEILGMKPEDLKTKLEKAATKEDIGAAIEAGITPFKTQFEELKAQIMSLSQPKPIESEPIDPNLEALTDPQKFLNDRLTPLAQANLETQAQLNEMRARNNPRFSEVFRQFGDELTRSALEKFTPQVRASQNFWDMHVKNILGDKILSGALKPTSFPSLLGSSSGAGGSMGEGNTEREYAEVDPEVAQHLKERGIKSERVKYISGLMKNGKITATSEAKNA